MDIELKRRIINFTYSRDVSTVSKRILTFVKDNDMRLNLKSLITSIPHTAPENIDVCWDRLCKIINFYINGNYEDLKKENKIIVDILLGIL